MKEVKIYKCPVCGNIVELIEGDIKRTKCCGQEMELLVANTVDAAVEKHVPVYEVVDNELVVTVGEVEHPMSEEHYIMWVLLVTDNRSYRVELKPNDKPVIKLPYVDNSTLYAYCNLHGLWKNEIK
jgi:superoxide reductase